MTTNNSPEKVVSRLVHSDYFENISPMYMKTWLPIIEKHREKCQHPKCKFKTEYNKLIEKLLNPIDPIPEKSKFIPFDAYR